MHYLNWSWQVDLIKIRFCKTNTSTNLRENSASQTALCTSQMTFVILQIWGCRLHRYECFSSCIVMTFWPAEKNIRKLLKLGSWKTTLFKRIPTKTRATPTLQNSPYGWIKEGNNVIIGNTKGVYLVLQGLTTMFSVLPWPLTHDLENQ